MDMCNRCGKAHRSHQCGWFAKQRESAALLAQDAPYAGSIYIGTADGDSYFASGTISPSIGDGLCLFRSLRAYVTNLSASELRSYLMKFLVENPKLLIKGTPLWKWVLWDALDKDIDFHMSDQPTDVEINVLVQDYANRILGGLWGGAIEATLFGHVFKLNVHEYESMAAGGYRRMNMFNYSEPTTFTINVAYKGHNHYDRLYPGGLLLNSQTAQQPAEPPAVLRDSASEQARSRSETVQRQQHGNSLSGNPPPRKRVTSVTVDELQANVSTDSGSSSCGPTTPKRRTGNGPWILVSRRGAKQTDREGVSPALALATDTVITKNSSDRRREERMRTGKTDVNMIGSDTEVSKLTTN
jgi:hypothetical protein